MNPLVFAVIEVACGEHGEDRIDVLVAGTDNGKSVRWFENYTEVVQERRKSEGERQLLVTVSHTYTYI